MGFAESGLPLQDSRCSWPPRRTQYEACCDLAGCMLELGLFESRLSSQPPSKLVAAALLLGNELTGQRQVWPAALERHLGRSWLGVRGRGLL